MIFFVRSIFYSNLKNTKGTLDPDSLLGSIYESDNLSFHKMRVKNRTLERSVDSQAFEYITMEDNGMKITLEFPCDIQDDPITSEIKCILAGMLNEYLEKIS